MSDATMLNPRNFVKSWFIAKLLPVREAAVQEGTFGSMYLDYHGAYRLFKHERALEGVRIPKPLHRDELQFAYNEYIDAQINMELQLACKDLAFNGSTLEALKTWVAALTGRVDDKDLAVMAHWLWLIKRKSLGLSVKFHIMPIVFGPQSGGKTTAIESLIAPIKLFQLNLPMTSISDDRFFKGMANNLVIFFDELQSVEKADMTVLKNQITTQFNTYRPMRTNLVVNVPMKCTFIGASNKPINESFFDATGMRRFYQIDALPKVDWDSINCIDYAAVWQCVDESLPNGYLSGDILSIVQQEQTRLVNPDPVSLFIDEVDLKPETGDEVVEVHYDRIFVEYLDWRAKNGFAPSNSAVFNREMINKGFKNRMKRDERGNKKRMFTINKKTTINTGVVFVQKLQAV